MKIGIRLHLVGVSLSNTVSELDRFGVDRCHSSVHNRVQKADRQPTEDNNTNHVAVDVTGSRPMISATGRTPPSIPRRTNFSTSSLELYKIGFSPKFFFTELREKHDISDAVCPVDGAPWLHEALRRQDLRFQHETHGNRNTIERLYKELKRRTDQFINHFRLADPATADTWLLPQAFCQNQLI